MRAPHSWRMYSWARLEDAGTLTLEAFVNGVVTGQDNRYLHDWSLSQNCPECDILSEFWVPSYFSDDMLQRCDPIGDHNLPYINSWPSLFIGGAGTRSDLHVDSFGSSFWMVLLEGQKHWRIYAPEATPLLYPVSIYGSVLLCISDPNSI